MSSSILYVTRTHDADGAGYCSDVASAVLEAVDEGADVVNLSLHCAKHFEPLASALVEAQEAGVVVVAAAGNSQETDPSACVVHPAAHPQAIAVGALEPTLEVADYSCRGESLEISAPGSHVLSTTIDGSYAFASGTSMAAPHVAATVSLMLSQDPSLSPSQVRETLNETARDLGDPGWDPAYGHGMVDPVAALTGRPVYVPTDIADPATEIEDPLGLGWASPAGQARCEVAGLSATGEASTGPSGYISLSGTGAARACETYVGDGNIQVLPPCLAASGTGNATGSPVALTGTGAAEADCSLFGLPLEASGCQLVEDGTGSSAACLDVW